jgi:hypothetical protein
MPTEGSLDLLANVFNTSAHMRRNVVDTALGMCEIVAMKANENEPKLEQKAKASQLADAHGETQPKAVSFDPEEVERIALSVKIRKTKPRRDPEKRSTGAWVDVHIKEAMARGAQKLATSETALLEASLILTMLRIGVVSRKEVDGWLDGNRVSALANLTLQRLTKNHPIKNIKQVPIFT